MCVRACVRECGWVGGLVDECVRVCMCLFNFRKAALSPTGKKIPKRQLSMEGFLVKYSVDFIFN